MAPKLSLSQPNGDTPAVDLTTLSEKYAQEAEKRLRSFPNLFLTGPSQIAVSANNTSFLDALAQHSAYIASEAMKRVDNSEKVMVENTIEAEEAWSNVIMAGVYYFAGMMGCTPGQLNNEGQAVNNEEAMKAARSAIYAQGINPYIEVLDGWRAEGSMEGVLVSS